ncbi:AGE2 [[Candida] subhashii]|uniref:AGE2 n=1 Tax=[Candida] subhashii TaxID=561895 RepID=A0A8J5QKU8_9ASCO|nr:AGE2 [[Candida] subhashii]KAG7662295.1 AGE2 [[Candida] subhashii]
MSYRSSNALPSSKKTHSERHKQILKQLLRENCNKVCADCKTSKNPRWASWSLGCFVCIRCSGIHRSMGTHISKVKSVDLDAWEDAQVENMVKWGNEKCNAYWESKLPEGYIPDSSKIENFIRTKYDLKKWTGSHHIPDPSTIKTSSPAPKVADLNDVKKAPVSTKPKQPVQHSINLLDDDFGDFSSTPSPKPIHATISSPTIVSRAAPTPQKQQSLPRPPSAQTQSAQSTGGSISSAGRPDLKKSILSLYSSPSSSSAFIPQVQQPPQQPQPPQARAQVYSNTVSSSSMNSLTGSLSGLNFNSPAAIPNRQPEPKMAPKPVVENKTPTVPPKSQWNTEWSDSSSSSTTSVPTSTNQWSTGLATSSANQWNSAGPRSNGLSGNGLDDDLFKNVWS